MMRLTEYEVDKILGAARRKMIYQNVPTLREAIVLVLDGQARNTEENLTAVLKAVDEDEAHKQESLADLRALLA